MRKRLLCIFLILIVCLTALPAAADTGQTETDVPVIRLAVDSSNPDRTVTVSVYLDRNPGLTSLKLKIGYDASLLTLISAESTSLIGDWFETGASTIVNPYVLVWVCADATTATGAVATLKFALPESTAVEKTDILIADSEAISEGTLLNADVEGCTLYLLCEHEYGDWYAVDTDLHTRQCQKCHYNEYQYHEWSEEEIIQPPSHKEAGLRGVTCKCGERRTESIPPTPEHSYSYYQHDGDVHYAVCECGHSEFISHAWEPGEIVNHPTHISYGQQMFVCVCEETRYEKIPPTTEHLYNLIHPFDAQYHEARCECGDQTLIPHKWEKEEILQSPTHSSPGLREYYCRCGASKSEQIPTIPGHHYNVYPHDAERHLFNCECGDEYFAPHEWDGGDVITEPTHTVVGLRAYHCACGAYQEEEIPPYPDHEYTPTGFDDNNHYAECSCGEKTVEPHKWDGGQILQAPTASESGIRRYSCHCGAMRDELLPPTGSSDSGAVTAPPQHGDPEPLPGESVHGGSEPGTSQGCASALFGVTALPALLLAAAVLSKEKSRG